MINGLFTKSNTPFWLSHSLHSEGVYYRTEKIYKLHPSMTPLLIPYIVRGIFSEVKNLQFHTRPKHPSEIVTK